MRNVTAAGRNVDEAVQSGLQELGLTKDKVEITVIEEGNKGFLGIFGKKPAIVKLVEKIDPIQQAKLYLQTIAEAIAGKSDVTVQESKKTVRYHITGEKAALLIGKRGQTLNALETLTQLALNRYPGQYKNVTVDAENYRLKRKETLSQLAIKLASTGNNGFIPKAWCQSIGGMFPDFDQDADFNWILSCDHENPGDFRA